MSEARTEPPTPRRIREARRRGEVARSREWQGAAVFAAGVGAIALAGPWAAASVARSLRAALLGAADPASDPGALLVAALRDSAAPGGALLLPPAIVGALAGLVPGGPILSGAPLAPRVERLAPDGWLRRVVSPEGALRVALGTAKAAAAVAIAWAWARGHLRSLGQLPRLGPGALAAIPLGDLALRLAAASLAFGLLDAALAWRAHRRRLRMTRDEVRREAAEDEGNPHHRAERRRHHRALVEAGPVGQATVVIVNPTHVAVALHHRRGDEAAPRVLAKGAGPAATRIRSVARRAGVPVVRDPPLARALLRLAEVGDEIPPELYDAAAAVLVHVHGMATTP